MTVKELIQELERYNENLPVMSLCEPVEKVLYNPEYYFGDSANPNCKIGPAIEIE